jgi:hypothetical protein
VGHAALMGEMRNIGLYIISVRKPEGKKPLERIWRKRY